MLTVRKTPPGGRPILDLVDALGDEIDESEDRVESQTPELTRARISALRHDLLCTRRPTATGYVWAVIIGTTLFQLVWFRRKRWF